MALNFMGKMRIWKIYGNLIILDLEILYTMYIIYCIQNNTKKQFHIQGEGDMVKHLGLKAYGKINLGLDVLRKREDGYHEVRMIMQTVHIFDQLQLEKRQEEGIRAAKQRGVRFGRPQKPLPENFKEACRRWDSGELVGRQAAMLCDMPLSTFYKRANQFRDKTGNKH